MDTLYFVAEAIVRFMQSSPPLPIGLLYIAIASIGVTFLHELGHAVAARRLIGGEVWVSVGSVGEIAELQLGRIKVAINALEHPNRVSGAAEFDASRATARDVLLIALAGPAASLAGTVLTAWALSAAPSSGVVHNLLWAATLGGVFGVLNLVPLTIHERRGGPVIRTDGRLALDALRVVRALA